MVRRMCQNMKSPQFSSWPSDRQTTNGGSVYSVSGSSPEMPAAFLCEAGTGKFGLVGAAVNNSSGVVNGGGRLAGQPAHKMAAYEVEPLPASKWKRVLDYALIAVSLPVTLPLGLAIAAWIKLVSRGKVIYRQDRVGLGGRPFTIMKFRSMNEGAPTQEHEEYLQNLIKNGKPMDKMENLGADPRIIPGGRCLRALGLDELPQLINVLRGDMSLVGPRPSTVTEFEHYEPAHKARVAVLPGLTGYWQVSGKNKLNFEQMINLDLTYINKRSLGLDLAIVIATIPALFIQLMESRVRGRRPAQDSEAADGVAEEPARRAC